MKKAIRFLDPRYYPLNPPPPSSTTPPSPSLHAHTPFSLPIPPPHVHTSSTSFISHEGSSSAEMSLGLCRRLGSSASRLARSMSIRCKAHNHRMHVIKSHWHFGSEIPPVFAFQLSSLYLPGCPLSFPPPPTFPHSPFSSPPFSSSSPPSLPSFPLLLPLLPSSTQSF